ncbi:hypothetical protein LCGC14_0967650 [marine sediment metagenome]|uniref:Uncharacterized protein n=1 Tax=marine sediment metagenome TaxID=412755 RepID=A0A0F9NH53_9ZZZZ
MKIIKTAKYKEANYLIVVPSDDVPGAWDVVHNIFPNMKHGTGQVIKPGIPSKEEAIEFANNLSSGEKVVVDETSFREHFDNWRKRNNDTPMGLEDDNPLQGIDY